MTGFHKYFDHTILSPDATAEEVLAVCREAIELQVASVCVNGYRTKLVADALKDTDVKVCTVIGFPLGAVHTDIKVFETRKAIEVGASEIDMVINVGALKDGDFRFVKEDIRMVKETCGDIILKVIIETCLLTDAEKRTACELALEAKADFVKTSTGFSKSGATKEDVAFMKSVVGGAAKVKASGGIRDYETAKVMTEAGADRLGTSATVSILKQR